MSDTDPTSLMEKLDEVDEQRRQADTQTDQAPTDNDVAYLSREFERLSQRLDTMQLTVAILLGYIIISALQ